MADIGSNAVASTQAGSRILRMFIPLSRDARQWAAEGSPYAPASSITAVTISGSRSCIGPARERQDDARFRCIVVAVDRKSVVGGKSVSVRVDLGWCGVIKKKNHNKQSNTRNSNNQI